MAAFKSLPGDRRLRFLQVGCICCLIGGTMAQGAPVQVPESVQQAEEQRIETMRHAAPAVVAIFDPSGKGGGSGVLIDPEGYAVTNFHVIAELGPFMKCGLNDGKLYDAVILGIDPTGDVALVRLLGRSDFPAARIGDSDSVRVGDWTFAMGNPFLLATDFQPTVTWGMVSGTHRYQFPAGTILEYTDCIQVDASINPGNSGGPLFDAQGELIGINGRISVEDRGRRNVGAGYAISINQVMNFLDHLKSGRIVDHATLGATVSADNDGALLIANILETSEAYRRGLRSGDELMSFAGRPMRSVNQFKNILGIHPKGWVVPLTFVRDNVRKEIHVRLPALHRRAELIQDDRSEGPPDRQPEKPGDPQEPPFKLPDGHPDPHEKKKPPTIPEQYASLWSEHPGFANHAANVEHQERLLAALRSWGDFTKTPAGWAIVGKLDDGRAVDVRLQPHAAAARLGDSFALQPLDRDFADQPPDTGGLLAALEQLKQLFRDPRGHFTEFYYVGSEPLDGSPQRVDVLIGTRGESESRFYFDKADGAFLGFDFSLEEYVDPCRIRFGELSQQGNVKFPGSLRILYADGVWGTVAVESVKFFEPETKSGVTP